MKNKPIARGHHYLSQCYLKGFTKKQTKDARLHVFDLHRGDWLPGAMDVKKVGKVRDFNIVDLPGVPPDALEISLSVFEGEVARVLRHLGETRTVPVGDDWRILVGFIALIAVRNPVCRENHRGFTEQVIEMIQTMSLATKERYESAVRDVRRAGGGIGLPDVPYEDMLRFHQEKGYELKIKNQVFYEGEFEAVAAVEEVLLDRKWLCLVSDGEGHFVTGDRPVRLRWIDPDLEAGPRPPGYPLTKTEVIFPVSKDVALAGTFEGAGGAVIADRLLVSKVNSLILTGCDRHLFSPRDHFDFFGSGKIMPPSHFSKEFRRKSA